MALSSSNHSDCARAQVNAGYVDRVFNEHRSQQQQIENELRNSTEYRQKHPGR
jgi:hypothetical protein